MFARGSGTDGEVGKTGVRRVQRELCGARYGGHLLTRFLVVWDMYWSQVDPYSARYSVEKHPQVEIFSSVIGSSQTPVQQHSSPAHGFSYGPAVAKSRWHEQFP